MNFDPPSPSLRRGKHFFAELKRRNVYKVAVAIPTMHPFAKQIVASLPLKE